MAVTCDYCDEVVDSNIMPMLQGAMDMQSGERTSVDLHPECIKPFMEKVKTNCKGERPKGNGNGEI